MKIEKGKWHIKLGFTPAYWKGYGLLFTLGIFKITSFPPEGEIFTKKNYKGFWIKKDFDKLILLDI